MTKTELVQTLAASCGITKRAARNLVDTLADTAITEVRTKGQFVLPGIGRLVRIDRRSDAPVDTPPDGSKRRILEIEVPPPKSSPPRSLTALVRQSRLIGRSTILPTV